MSRPENPACGWSTSRMMVDNLQAQLAPIELYGAAELALPVAIGLGRSSTRPLAGSEWAPAGSRRRALPRRRLRRRASAQRLEADCFACRNSEARRGPFHCDKDAPYL